MSGPAGRPTKLNELARDYALKKAVERVAAGVYDSADTCGVLRAATLEAADSLAELTRPATVPELRAVAFRLRGTALQLARVLDDITTAAARVEGFAWTAEGLELEPDGEDSEDDNQEEDQS